MSESEGKDSKTYHFGLVTLNDYGRYYSIELNSDDTVESFVQKIGQQMVDLGLADSGNCIKVGCQSPNFFLQKEDSEKPLTDFVNLSAFESSPYQPTILTLVFSVNDGFIINYKPDDWGKLPLYEVVSEEDAVDPQKKYNYFRKTDKFVQLSTSPRPEFYEGFGLDNKEKAFKANNPLYRFICSDHLKNQKETGRLTCAQDIFDRKIGGFDTMSEREAEQRNIKEIPQAETQRGWQGINAEEYIKAFYNNSTGLFGNNYKDVEKWYGTLSNILLDKAYLSVDSNLDILISIADKLFDEGKIKFDQFTNVILMLRYAYELRKLPNEKGASELNNDIKPIKLNAESRAIVEKILRLMQDKWTKLICQDVELKKKIMGYDQNMSLNINNDDNEVSELDDKNVEMIKMYPDPANEKNENQNQTDLNKAVNSISDNVKSQEELNKRLIDDKKGEVDPANENKNENQNQMDLGKAVNVIANSVKSQEDLNNKLRSKQTQYLQTLLDAIGENKDTRVKAKRNNEEYEFSINGDSVAKLRKQIEDMFQKGDFEDLLSKFSTGISNPDEENGVIMQLDGNLNISISIDKLLSDDNKKSLQRIASDISDISKQLTKLKKLTDSDVFKKILKCCEIYKYANCAVQQNSEKIPIELSWLQWLVNFILSLGHLRDYRYYKEFGTRLNNIVSFKNEDDIFDKYNKKKEEKLVPGIPEPVYYELNLDKGY